MYGLFNRSLRFIFVLTHITKKKTTTNGYVVVKNMINFFL